ncbi:hypothetical protein [Brevibacterium aurantiacum]|uniref:hypothetical protein n=1 Tax=Brevibacterium aurantiacum TaxID=273384 RepID=UPI001C905803|nr:hypothetical protein [Brevibacterium aurantiacum]
MRAGVAYAALLNNIMLTISIGDDRLIHKDGCPRDHAIGLFTAALGAPSFLWIVMRAKEVHM